MTEGLDHLDQWESAFERRSIGRTRIIKGVLLFFSGQPGVHACTITNITNAGAGIRTQALAALPLNFELSFDNFRTARKCRLIWRDGDFFGVAFDN
jgi:chorismate-pyruvate lyase